MADPPRRLRLVTETDRAGKPHLVIETSDATDRDLAYLMEHDRPPGLTSMNKTTATNRAIQLYTELVRARAAGENLYVGQRRLGSKLWRWL